MKWQRIISLATLGISIFTLVLVLKRPAPVAAPPASPTAAAANARSFQEKVSQIEQAKPSAEGNSEVRISAEELSAAVMHAATSAPASAPATTSANNNGSSSAPPAGGAMELPGPLPNIKDYQVSMDGDVVRGQFLTQVAGKDVYVTLAGHLGAKDGYATFDATEFKVGDLSVPVSLVNDALQKKLLEQRDQLKLPENVKDLKVENGELVLVPK